jgi:YVTN family beta-propeller protein
MSISRCVRAARLPAVPIMLALAFIGCAAIANAPAVPPSAVLATIPVGNPPTYLAMSPDGARVYAASNGSFTVIDTGSNAVVAKISIDPNSTGIAVTPNGVRVLITSLFSVKMAVVDTAANTLASPITLLAQRFTGGFGRIAVLPGNPIAWVANQDNEVLAIANLDDAGTEARDIDMRPVDLGFSPDGQVAYVAGCKEECVPGTVEVINTAARTTQAYINVGPSPYRIAVAPDGAHFYTTNLGDASLSVIDVATRSAVATVRVGIEPTGLAVSRDGSSIYVTSQDLGTVTAIDAASSTIRSALRVGNRAREVVVTPDGKRLYVSTQDAVVALETRAFIGAS